MTSPNYANVMPVFSVNFKDTMRALPAMDVVRQDTALTFNGKEYKYVSPNAPLLTASEVKNEPIGLRCDAARRLLVSNTIQSVDPTTQLPYGSAFSSGTFRVIGSGYEDGIPYNDIHLNSSMSSGFASFLPFVISPVTEVSTFSAYIKKISGNFSPAKLHLNLRHHNKSYSQILDRTTPLFNIEATESIPLRKTRKQITTPANNILKDAATSCLVEFIGQGSIDGVFRLGCPQLVSGNNVIPPLPVANGVMASRAATRYHVKKLTGMRSEGCAVLEATTHNPEATWQDIFILSDTEFGFNNAVGISLTQDGELNIVSGSNRITVSGFANRTFKIAINWGSGACSIVVDGAIIGVIDGVAFVPVSLQLGCTIGTSGISSSFTGEISGISIYNQKLGDKELIALTK